MIDRRQMRCRIHAALADPTRLAIVDELSVSDRAPGELAAHLTLPGNLLAHHLDVLDRVGLIARFESSGDRRRRYVRLKRRPLLAIGLPIAPAPSTVLFVCTHNSARSQIAAALWSDRFGTTATSAGTHPADQIHPAAIAAAARAGLDLSTAVPRLMGPVDHDVQIVTVCDRAHEELHADETWWHWSIPDPIEDGSDAAFDVVVTELDERLATLDPRPKG